MLARNLRAPCAELDLLAEDPSGALVIVEVKAVTPASPAEGEQRLGARQRRRLESALLWLARRQPASRALRLDLALVLQQGGEILDWQLLEGLAGIEPAQRGGGDAGG